MILVKIELHPYGDERYARTLREMSITNVGGNERVGKYEVHVSGQPIPGNITHERTKDVTRLVETALQHVHAYELQTLREQNDDSE